MKPPRGKNWSAMAYAVNVLSPEIIMCGDADSFQWLEGGKSRIDRVRDGIAPGVRGSATVPQGNGRNLGDPYRRAVRRQEGEQPEREEA